MKKAFTLIELLVVIAIIAILAAILFPVFAQAKLAAKKAVSISNQKQIGLAILMYSNDYDDMYPREDGCTLNDSFNTVFDSQPAGTNPNPFCSGKANPGGYAFRDNHYSWGKWVQPYSKSTALFIDPVLKYDPTGWSVDGEVDGGYALNLAITGALNTWNYPTPYTNSGAIRNSFLGGTQTSVPEPADAMIMMDQPVYSVVGGIEWPTSGPTLTYYPLAVREHWASVFYTQGGSGFCGETTTVDNNSVPYTSQVPLSYCDGHTKVIAVGQFLANTPSAAQFGISDSKSECPIASSYYFEGNVPSWTQSWPMWGLG